MLLLVSKMTVKHHEAEQRYCEWTVAMIARFFEVKAGDVA
jgi:hypothetical protein